MAKACACLRYVISAISIDGFGKLSKYMRYFVRFLRPRHVSVRMLSVNVVTTVQHLCVCWQLFGYFHFICNSYITTVSRDFINHILKLLVKRYCFY